MKALVISLIFFSQFSMAARIVGAGWDTNSQSVVVKLAYQGGCVAHNFSVQWDQCVVDPVSQKTTRFGLILDSGWQDTCGVEQSQTLVAQEIQDGCQSQTLILKSSSSKTTVVVDK